MDRGEALTALAALLACGVSRPAGSSVPQRPALSRGMIDVLDYGAKGDGVADDSEAIQAAHDAGPGILFFPAGTYKVTRTVRVTKTTIIQGAGSSMNFKGFLGYNPVTKLLWDGPEKGEMLKVFRVNGGGIRDIALDGNGRAATGICAEGMQHATWENVSVDRTAAGSANDAAIVLHGGADPYQNNVMFCRFANIGLTNVAKGWLLTSRHRDTDVSLNVYQGLWVSFVGDYALRVEAGDNNDFINFYQNRLSGNGNAIELTEPTDVLFGARYNYFYHPQGNDAPVVVDTPYVNLAFACDHSNGMPNPTGKHPENLSQIGTSGGDIGVKGSVAVESGSGFVVGALQVVGSRRTGWSAATGRGTRTSFDTSRVTLLQLAERVKALIDDLSSHGLIGP